MYTVAIFALILIIPWMVIPMEIKRKKSPYGTVLKSTLVTMATIVGVLAIASFAGNPLYQQYQEYISEVIKTIMADDQLLQMTGLEGGNAEETQKTLLSIYTDLFEIMPGYFMLLSALVSYLYYITISKAYRLKNPDTLMMPRFREFRYPQSVISGMVIMYFGTLLATKCGVFPNDVIFNNINYIFEITFIIQAASVIFMACEMRMGKVGKIIAVILVVIFWNVFIIKEIMVMIGLFDMVFNIKGIIVLKQQLKDQDQRNKRM